jgi:hypothetical protein
MQFVFSIDGRTKKKTYSPNTTSNVGSGEMFGTIFNAIKKNMPQEVLKFEQQALQQTMQSNSGALKYQGPPIKPFKIEALVNNQWVDVTNQNPPAQQPQPVQPTQQQPMQPNQTPQTPQTPQTASSDIRINRTAYNDDAEPKDNTPKPIKNHDLENQNLI